MVSKARKHVIVIGTGTCFNDQEGRYSVGSDPVEARVLAICSSVDAGGILSEIQRHTKQFQNSDITSQLHRAPRYVRQLR